MTSPNALHLGLSLSIAGPREGLMAQEQWPLALRVTVGRVAEPDAADAATLLEATVPWKIWEQGLPRIAVYSESGTRLCECVAENPLPENAAFAAAIAKELLDTGRGLIGEPGGASQLSFRFVNDNTPVTMQGAQATAMPWPGLLATLNTLAQPTPSFLRATWFFKANRADLCTQQPDGSWQPRCVALHAFPLKLEEKDIASVSPEDGAALAKYDVTDARAHCNALVFQDTLAHGLDELDNYWLSIRDSRDDSLLDLVRRVEAALVPTAILAALRRDELISYCVTIDPDTMLPRDPLSAEMDAAVRIWTQVLAGRIVVQEARDEIVRAMFASPLEAALAIREAYRNYITLRLHVLNDVAGVVPLRFKPDAPEQVALLLDDRLLASFAPSPPLPCQPNEGIQLVVGDERLRLVHEDQTSGAAVDEVAAIQLFARRSSVAGALDVPAEHSAHKWHALTGARYALGEGAGQTLGVARAMGVTATYQDGVLYRELAYFGSNLVCRNPLERVHAEDMSDADMPSIALNLDRLPVSEWALRAVPLRYGDYYTFAAGVIDRAGAQAHSLASAAEPWRFDAERMANMAPPQQDTVRFLRRVPLGSCNIQPVVDADAATSAQDWPEMPAEVWPRCLEQHGAVAQGERPTAVLLVPQDAAQQDFGLGKGAARPARWVHAIQFSVEPPVIDEHTLQRWGMPATDLGKADAARSLAQLVGQLKDIHVRRFVAHETGSYGGEQPLPFDPAVAMIGLRLHINDRLQPPVFLGAARHVLSFEAGAHTSLDPRTLVGTVAPGDYLRLGFVVLVTPDAFDRLDVEALGHLIEESPWTVDRVDYAAFKESVVYIECASSELPELDIEHFRVRADAAGDVGVYYDFSHLQAHSPELLRNAHQMRISSRRWVWRNLPVLPRDWTTLDEGTPEWRRRMASGPPLALFGGDADRDKDVAHYDDLSRIDDGFVGREEVLQRLPRERAPDTALYVDGREGIAAADYLRYSFRVGSRYRGVLRNPESAAVGPRRIATGYRGDAGRIKPPRILAVMPMTKELPQSPRHVDAGEAQPFLVIVDELWHREYGIGERLQARVAHVKAEIEDGNHEPAQFRFGPVPDHSVTPKKIDDLSEPLDVLGPFGFSLDRSGSQARANATGFVVYAPKETPAHFNLFLEFERVLDRPSGARDARGGNDLIVSRRSEAIPVYGLPASTGLDPLRLPAGAALTLKETSARAFTYAPNALELTPFRQARGEVMTQYRYLMIVGREVHDGGRAVEVFLPGQALWLQDGRASLLEGALQQGWTHAVVCEILLNGRYPLDGTHPLSGATDLRQLFRLLFPSQADPAAEDEDAPGMFRRFSSTFRIDVRGK